MSTPGTQKAFEKSKEVLCSEQVLKRFDPARHTVLITNASRTGLGYVIIQTNEKLEIDASTRGSLKRMPKEDLISCGSWYISGAEKNYAMVELELLALQWATEKARLYLLGAHFSAVTDHQPLVAIVHGQNHNAHSNARIQSILAKLIGYDLALYWTQGKANVVADALSRAPVWPAPEDADILACTARVAMARKKPMDENVAELTCKAMEDKNYQAIYLTLQAGKQPKDLP